ncbi:hypothetical protein [Haloplanus natans]|uniref:hypothetical protein n=1 Tax=Haloplanus natans TaxID=376171 RepID=UPI0006777C08|nr:hypothetical protein [Haloplanus natans]
MRAEFEDGWHPSTKLNVIGAALDFTRVDPLPENVTRDEIEEYCYTLEQLYGSYVERVAAETTLSEREATTWVLRNLVHDGADRLTFDAIGLYVWAIGRSADGDPLSRTIVADYHDRARGKIDAAEATVEYTQPPPYPADLFEEPTPLWVEGRVVERLARHLGPEESFSDAVERLLDETVETVELRALIETLRDDRGAAAIGVQTVRPDWDRDLPLSVHVPDPGAASLPPAVADADAVRIGDRVLPFGIEERSTGTGTGSMLTVFDDGDGDGERVDPSAGVDRLHDALAGVEATLPELVERAEATGVAALAVADRPAGTGLHLLAVDGPADAFAHLERLLLDDRTLAVERVTRPTVEAYADGADTTLLWTAPDAGLDETRDLPADPAERRDRLPTAVLRTG